MASISITHPTDRSNFTVVELNDLTVWFSYKTPIAFHLAGELASSRPNEWGPTTGKHLAAVNRSIPTIQASTGEVFEHDLDAAIARATASTIDPDLHPYNIHTNCEHPGVK